MEQEYIFLSASKWEMQDEGRKGCTVWLALPQKVLNDYAGEKPQKFNVPQSLYDTVLCRLNYLQKYKFKIGIGGSGNKAKLELLGIAEPLKAS